MKFNIVLLIVLVLLGQCSFAESDLLSSSNGWEGSVKKYTVDNGQLALRAEEAGVAAVSKLVSMQDTVLWSVSFEFNFSPSGSNQFRIYFMSDNQIDSVINEALYLEVGESGSNDGLNLCSVKNGKTVLIDKLYAGSFTKASVIHNLILRKVNSEFTLLVDTNLEYKFNLNVHPSLYNECHVAIYNRFTKSNLSGFRVQRFQFGIDLYENLKIEELIFDHSRNRLIISFNQSLVGLTLSNFHVPTVGDTFNFEFDSDTLFVVFEHLFTIEKLFQVMLTFKDFQNKSVSLRDEFWFYRIDPYDVIFTEVMYDQESNTGYLHEGQYIELYNRSEHPVDLQKLKLLIQGGSVSLPGFTLENAEYVVLMKDSTSSVHYMNVLPVDNWKSISVTSGEIGLYSGDDLIDDFRYDKDHYGESFKKNGGWSVELMDIGNFCQVKDNWVFSEDPLGGTPGESNSIAFEYSTPELSIDALFFKNDSQITFQFNKKLSMPFFSRSNLKSDLEIDTIFPSSGTSNEFTFTFKEKMKKDHLYNLVIQGLFNCSENSSETKLVGRFGTPGTLATSQLIINEILSDANLTSEDFIEIYNNSNKIIDLSDVLIGIFDDQGMLKDTYQIASKSRLFLPFSYLCLTSNVAKVKNQFIDLNTGDSLSFLSLNQMPSLPAESGNVGLVNKSGDQLDLVPYLSSWHSDYLVDTKGVSLERISFAGESNDASNWSSAAFDVNFGSPGYANSNGDNTGKSKAWEGNNFYLLEDFIDLRTFSEGAGLNLLYKNIESGFVLTGALYSSDGTVLMTLCESVPLGASGELFFDVNPLLTKVRASAVCIVVFEAVHPHHNKIKMKQAVSIF